MYTANQSIDHIIVTSQDTASVVALNEIQKVDNGARLIKKLSFEEQLVIIPSGYKSFINTFQNIGFIFTRHIFPVSWQNPALPSNNEIALLLDKNQSFSIQWRTNIESKFKENCRETVICLENALISEGFIHNHKNPEQIISIYFSNDTVFMGISNAVQNLSAHNGGMHRFKKAPEQISRAEFKLLEAILDFNIPLIENGLAIDLGAAPGGWTKILLENGYAVTAIDPAKMDERITAQYSKFIHFQGSAQYFAAEDESVDLIVNDMRMDMLESCQIMLEMSRFLKQNGQAVMTLKLSDGNLIKKTNKVLRLLEKSYIIKKAKQLFHNRSEVTVWLEKN